MGNISIRKNDAPATVTRQQQAEYAWDPHRWMRNFLQWDPFREAAPLRAFDETWSYVPAFEVKETKDAFVFKADVPGIKEADLEVTITGNRLTISGKREEEKRDQNDTYYAYERSYGSFMRAFTLPDGTDPSKSIAELKDGVLLLTLPKTPEAQPKKIAVKTANAPKS